MKTIPNHEKNMIGLISRVPSLSIDVKQKQFNNLNMIEQSNLMNMLILINKA